MIDRDLLNQASVLVGKIDEVLDSLPDWKRKALLIKIDECHEIIKSQDRRNKSERRAR